MQCDLHTKRKTEAAYKAGLSLRLESLEIDGSGLQSPLGTSDPSLRPTVRPWFFERQVALEDKEGKEKEKAGLCGHDGPIMAHFR